MAEYDLMDLDWTADHAEGAWVDGVVFVAEAVHHSLQAASGDLLLSEPVVVVAGVACNDGEVDTGNY